VLKPDDGAGCDDTVRVPHWHAARERLTLEPGRYVAEPWVEGDPMSLSLLANRGQAVLLACNRQLVKIEEGCLTLTGLQVNAVPDPTGAYAELAGRIALCVPSLWGYVGVDLVLGAEGPVVVEVNPRLTTSYCGLRHALGINVAAMVLSLLDSDHVQIPARPVGRTTVELVLESSSG
jgi:predicted ATP-grasp superfamily ATP-dependent carboligase